MKESNGIFQAIERIDENGEIRASCCLMIEKKYEDVGLTPEIRKLAHMWDVSVKVSLADDFVVVDLCFEGDADYDYQQALELCKGFPPKTGTGELGEKLNSDLSLILYIIPKGEYDFFLMGIDAAWELPLEKQEGMCNAIRLLFVKENFGAYELKSRQ